MANLAFIFAGVVILGDMFFCNVLKMNNKFFFIFIFFSHNTAGFLEEGSAFFSSLQTQKMWRLHTSLVVLGVIVGSFLIGWSLRPSTNIDELSKKKMKAILSTSEGKIEMKEVSLSSSCLAPSFLTPFPKDPYPHPKIWRNFGESSIRSYQPF